MVIKILDTVNNRMAFIWKRLKGEISKMKRQKRWI
jgi:hypothetical protein